MNSHFLSPFLWASVAGILVIAAFNSWTSRINQFFFFSRTVPSGFRETPQARRIRRKYLFSVWSGCAFAIATVFALDTTGHFYVLGCFTGGLLVQCAFACAGFAAAHRDTGRVLAALPISDDVPAERSTPISVALLDRGAFPQHLVTLFFAAPAAALLVALGSMLAVHMGLQAFSDAIGVNKAEFLTGLGLGMMAGSMVLFVQLRYFSRHRSPMGRFTANGCVQLAWLGAACFAFSTLSVPLHIFMTPQIKRTMLGIVLVIAIARLLYGWSRAKLFPPPQFERNGDEFWRWGLFYYNPSDPTVFIQHRSGPGYTVNFAKTTSWVLVTLLLADFAFLLLIHPHH